MSERPADCQLLLNEATTQDMADELARRHEAVLLTVTGRHRGKADSDLVEVHHRGPFAAVVGLMELAKAKAVRDFFEDTRDNDESPPDAETDR